MINENGFMVDGEVVIAQNASGETVSFHTRQAFYDHCPITIDLSDYSYIAYRPDKDIGDGQKFHLFKLDGEGLNTKMHRGPVPVALYDNIISHVADLIANKKDIGYTLTPAQRLRVIKAKKVIDLHEQKARVAMRNAFLECIQELIAAGELDAGYEFDAEATKWLIKNV